MKKYLCILTLLAITGLMGCTQSNNISIGDISIETDIDSYSPIMSSTVGIGLSPIVEYNGSLGSIKYHWYTDNGHFLAWGPPDFIVKRLGADFINNGEKIYWAYFPDENDSERSSIKITLTLEDSQSGHTIAETSLGIEWEDQYTVVVSN
ncbi:hypothetical protein ACFLW0_01695 [Chloroflexota bacterium]